MKLTFQIFLSFLLLQFSGNEVSCKSFFKESKSANSITQIDYAKKLFTLKGAFPIQDVPEIYLLECEEDDEKTNKEQFAPLCLLLQSDSKQLHSIHRVESYPVSTNSRFRFCTKRYIAFRSFRV